MDIHSKQDESIWKLMTTDELMALNSAMRSYVRQRRWVLNGTSAEQNNEKRKYGTDYLTRIRKIEAIYRKLSKFIQSRTQLRLWE